MIILNIIFLIRVGLDFLSCFPISSIVGVKSTNIYISLYMLYSYYVEFFHYVRDLPPLKILIKEFIDNLALDSENLEFFWYLLFMRG